MKMNRKKNIVFAVFLVIMLFQMWNVGIYFDDYGYLTLSYKYIVEGVNGHSYTIAQLFEFLVGHYMIWGGRILYFGIYLLLSIKNVYIFKVLQAFVITFIFFMISKICGKDYEGKSKVIISIISVLTFSLFQLNAVKDCFYWLTAASLYVWPFLPFFISMYFTFIVNGFYKKNNLLYPKVIKCIVLVATFFATFSQEQISFSFLVFTIIILGYSIYNKQHIKFNVINFFSALLGFIILYIAPGNWIRDNTENGVFNKLLQGLINFISNFTNGDFFLIWIIFIFIFIFVAYKTRKCNRFFKFLNPFLIFGNIVHMMLLVFFQGMFFTKVINQGYAFMIFVTLFMSMYLLIEMIQIIYYFYVIKKNSRQIIILVSGISMLAAVIYAPYCTDRMIVVLIISLLPIIVELLYDICKSDRFVKKIGITGMFFCFTLGVISFTDITYNYYLNAQIMNKNDRTLENYGKMSNPPKIIKLRKNQNSLYNSVMPYQLGTFKGDIKKYYNLPGYVEFEWFD